MASHNGENEYGTRRAANTDRGGRAQVLIANLEQRMADFLRVSLEKNGIGVEMQSDVFDALFGEVENRRDCIIMQADPVVISEITSGSLLDVPILAIVEDATVEARVRVLDAGADDCLKSPFAISELVARTRALSRRSRAGDSKGANSEVLHDFEYVKDLKLVKRSDRNVALTHTEDVILGCLLESVGGVLKSSELAFRIWGSTGGDKTNLVAVHMANLRRKIDRGHPYRLIHTARGRGYFIDTREKLNSIRSITAGHSILS